jgi:hypothetical protein
MSSIKLKGSTSGDITISAPAVAGTNTLTLPANSGEITVGGNNTPAFQAELSADQTISSNVITKVQFDTEIFDTDGCYDNTTNYRFTPTVAGKYFVYAQIRSDSAGNSQGSFIASNIQKNGSIIAESVIDFRSNNGRQAGLSLNTVVEMNGSTDYLEGYGRLLDTSGSPKFESVNSSNYFGAYKLIGV